MEEQPQSSCGQTRWRDVGGEQGRPAPGLAVQMVLSQRYPAWMARRNLDVREHHCGGEKLSVNYAG